MPQPSTIATAQRIFAADLARNLFANNSFLTRSLNWNQYAKGRNVNFNQSGAKPSVIINRNSTPLTPARRVDILRTYELDEYQSNPNIIDWTDEMVINYAKRQDVLRSHVAQVENDIALRVLFNWVSNAKKIVRTTGTARLAATPGATGNRASVSYKDWVNCYAELVGQDVTGEVNALIPAGLLPDVLSIDQLIEPAVLRARGNAPDFMLGFDFLGQILGVNVFTRSAGIIFNNAGTPVAQSPKVDDSFNYRTAAAADNQSILFWGSSNVTTSISPDSLVNIVPFHGGNEFSLTTIAGGNRYYEDGTGLVVLVEAAAA